MRGVGPAGRWFTTPNVRGRNMVVTIGGRTRVGMRTLKRKDYVWISPAILMSKGEREATANFREPHRRSIMRRW